MGTAAFFMGVAAAAFTIGGVTGALWAACRASAWAIRRSASAVSIFGRIGANALLRCSCILGLSKERAALKSNVVAQIGGEHRFFGSFNAGPVKHLQILGDHPQPGTCLASLLSVQRLMAAKKAFKSR